MDMVTIGATDCPLCGVTWPGPLEPERHSHTHTGPADAIKIVASLALAAETARGVQTVVALPTGLCRW